MCIEYKPAMCLTPSADDSAVNTVKADSCLHGAAIIVGLKPAIKSNKII